MIRKRGGSLQVQVFAGRDPLTGRKRVYCSRACQQAAYRARQRTGAGQQSGRQDWRSERLQQRRQRHHQHSGRRDQRQPPPPATRTRRPACRDKAEALRAKYGL